MTSRNSFAEIDNSLVPNRVKRKNEDSLQNDPNKRSCLKASNQANIMDTKSKNIKNDKFRKIKRLKTNDNAQVINELTPTSSITCSFRSTIDSITPLPNFAWANPTDVWNMMSKDDQQFNRDSTVFTRHPSLQPIMRAMLLDWLNEVCQAYNLTRQTYYLALDFFDRYLSLNNDMPKKRLQLLGITCLFIAAKIEEIFPPKLDRFSFVCDGACDETEILAKELVVLNALKWELSPMTPISWLNVYMQIQKCKNSNNSYASMDKENLNDKQVGENFLFPDYESKLFVQIAHLIDLCTLNAGSLVFSYSVIAASAFYHFTNESVVLQCTGKSMSELSPCIEWMIPFAIAIKNEGLDFVNKLPLEDDRSTTIQSHTVSLELLKCALAIQSEIESDKMTSLESSDNSSLCSSLTPSKMPLTPPRSS